MGAFHPHFEHFFFFMVSSNQFVSIKIFDSCQDRMFNEIISSSASQALLENWLPIALLEPFTKLENQNFRTPIGPEYACALASPAWLQDTVHWYQPASEAATSLISDISKHLCCCWPPCTEKQILIFMCTAGIHRSGWRPKLNRSMVIFLLRLGPAARQVSH